MCVCDDEQNSRNTWSDSTNTIQKGSGTVGRLVISSDASLGSRAGAVSMLLALAMPAKGQEYAAKTILTPLAPSCRDANVSGHAEQGQ